MTKRRTHRTGGIDKHGKSWRLRYWKDGKQHRHTVKGARADAEAEMRRLLRSIDTGEHVTPDGISLTDWATHWIAIGAPGRRKKANGARTVERYDELLTIHVLPTLGDKKLQRINSTDIDKLYLGLEEKLAP